MQNFFEHQFRLRQKSYSWQIERAHRQGRGKINATKRESEEKEASSPAAASSAVSHSASQIKDEDPLHIKRSFSTSNLSKQEGKPTPSITKTSTTTTSSLPRPRSPPPPLPPVAGEWRRYREFRPSVSLTSTSFRRTDDREQSSHLAGDVDLSRNNDVGNNNHLETKDKESTEFQTDADPGLLAGSLSLSSNRNPATEDSNSPSSQFKSELSTKKEEEEDENDSDSSGGLLNKLGRRFLALILRLLNRDSLDRENDRSVNFSDGKRDKDSEPIPTRPEVKDDSYFPIRLVKSVFRFLVFRLDSRLLFASLLIAFLTWFYWDFAAILFRFVILPIFRFLGEASTRFVFRPFFVGAEFLFSGFASVLITFWPTSIDEAELASRLRQEVELRRAIGEDANLATAVEGGSFQDEVGGERELYDYYADFSHPSIVATLASFLFSSLSYFLSSLLTFLFSLNLPLPSLPSFNPFSLVFSFLFRRRGSGSASLPQSAFEAPSSTPHFDAAVAPEESIPSTPIYYFPALFVHKIYVIVVNIRFDGKQPITMLNLVYLLSRLVFGTLYPAYCSYKAVKSKNVREYVKWMMYWIVFALFTSAETFADIFLSWAPFYYEVKVVFVIWLLSPYTQGSSVLYRKFIHPALARRENEIDDMISKAKEQGYSAVLTLGSKAMTSATNLALQAVTKGPEMLDQFRRSYSSSDVNQVQITELNDDGEPLRYDNDLALVQTNRRTNAARNIIDSEEETEMRVREDAAYLEDRRRRQNRVDGRRPMRSSMPAPPEARQTRTRAERDASERKQRLETWEEDLHEAESVTSSSFPSSSSSPASPSSISPGFIPESRYSRHERLRYETDSPRKEDADDDDRYDDDYEDELDRRVDLDRQGDRQLDKKGRPEETRGPQYPADEYPVYPHPPAVPRTKTLAEMSLDERLKELESYGKMKRTTSNPSLSSARHPSLARINRHYVSGLRKDEELRKSAHAPSSYYDYNLRSNRL